MTRRSKRPVIQTEKAKNFGAYPGHSGLSNKENISPNDFYKTESSKQPVTPIKAVCICTPLLSPVKSIKGKCHFEGLELEEIGGQNKP